MTRQHLHNIIDAVNSIELGVITLNKKHIGTTSANGWPFLSFEERFAIYKRLGFHSIMLWWGEGEEETRKDRVAVAKEHNLYIENVHAEMEYSNSITPIYGAKKLTGYQCMQIDLPPFICMIITAMKTSILFH